MDFESVYSVWLKHNQELNKEKYDKHKGKFSASSAGSCYRKQMYRRDGYEGTELKARNARLLRLGTIVHKDFEEAVKRYKIYSDFEHQIFVEHEIVIPDLNLVGHLDFAIVDEANKRIEVFDLKTCGTYKWRLKYGRGAVNKIDSRYAMQVGTYGIGLGIKHDITDITLWLIWYNKDTSTMKTEHIPSEYMDSAFEYWTECNEIIERADKPKDLQVGDIGVPFSDWECRYCEYRTLHCPGV
tara:strand:- start:407 stop:1129 length:723 start_codon:yes stop_codon:yes gene_type:complete